MSDLTPRDRLLAQMEARLLAEVQRRRQRNRRMKWAALSLTGLIATGAAVSAWVWLVAPSFADRGAHCYTAADTAASFVEAALANRSDGEPIAVGDQSAMALEICGALWASGVMGDPRPDQPLFVCRDTDATLQVFPRENGRDDCAAVGSTDPK